MQGIYEEMNEEEVFNITLAETSIDVYNKERICRLWEKQGWW